MKKKYSFQSLLYYKNNSIIGPKGPIIAINEVSKIMNIKNITGACRVQNNQAYSLTYYHFIIRSAYKSCKTYHMFIDMGSSYIPCALWFDNDDCVITPVYKEETTPKKMDYHRKNKEHPKSKDNPIMILNKKEFIKIFKQAEASGELEINKE